MRGIFGRIRSAIDPRYAVVVAICLLAVWPFLKNASLPAATDAELHIFRLAELSRLWQAGVGYPRWAPNFYFGYGYPIFNYYAPLTYYLGLPFVLLGLTPVAAVKIVFIAGLLGAGTGMFALMRDRWGNHAGYVAAAAYVYAPYIQFIDPHARGVLAESFSFALLPWALWAVARLQRRPSAAIWAATAFFAAGIVLAHNLMALVFGGIVAAWWVWLTVVEPPTGDATRLRQAAISGAALALGVGVAAFFWLPLVLERNAVTLSTLIDGGSHYDFRNHFLSIAELLAPSRRLDWGATEPRYAFNLGIVPALLGVVGIIRAVIRRDQNAWHTLFFIVGTLALIGLMLPLSTPLWAAIPLLPYLQFPWRLLGATAAMLAVVAGSAFGGEPRLRWRAGQINLAPLAVGLLLLGAWPLSQVPPWAAFGPTGVKDALRIELSGRWLGTTSTADYVPATVDVVPEPNSFQLENYFEDRPVDRFNWVAVPPDSHVIGTVVDPLHMRYETDSAESFFLRLFLFDFPGWTARIDGVTVETEIGRPEGFIVVPVPAGQHTVDVSFESTPPRRAGWAISGVALLGVIAGGWWVNRPNPAHARLPLARSEWVVLSVTLVLFVGLITIVEPRGWLHYNSDQYVAQPAQHAYFADYDGQIALIGYDAALGRLQRGQTIDVTLYWKAQQAQSENYQVFVHILRSDGTVLAQSDKLNPGNFPTTRWPTDRYVRDVHRVALPSAIEPGVYTLTAGLWNAKTGDRLYVFDGSGDLSGEYSELATIRFGQ